MSNECVVWIDSHCGELWHINLWSCQKDENVGDPRAGGLRSLIQADIHLLDRTVGQREQDRAGQGRRGQDYIRDFFYSVQSCKRF